MATFTVTFQPGEWTVEVDPELYPYGRTGRPGSLLDIALTHGVSIPHACEGEGICGTCCVMVTQGQENLWPAGDNELDRLDGVAGSTLNSRLACQAVVRGDVTVEVPEEA